MKFCASDKFTIECEISCGRWNSSYSTYFECSPINTTKKLRCHHILHQYIKSMDKDLYHVDKNTFPIMDENHFNQIICDFWKKYGDHILDIQDDKQKKYAKTILFWI